MQGNGLTSIHMSHADKLDKIITKKNEIASVQLNPGDHPFLFSAEVNKKTELLADIDELLT